MMDELKEKNIIINRIHIDPKKMFSPKAKIEAFLAQDQQLKDSAQRAFVSYIKSVFLMKNKNVFKVQELDMDSFAKSLGLVSLPRIRFIDRIKYMRLNNAKKDAEIRKQSDDSTDVSDDDDDDDDDLSSNEDQESSEEESDEEDAIDESDKSDSETKNHGVDFNVTSDSEEEEDLFRIKRKNHEIEQELSSLSEDEDSKATKNKIVTKAAIAKRVLKKKIVANKKVLFNEDGEEVLDDKKQLLSELGREYMDQNSGGIDIEMAKRVMQEEDKFDRKRQQELAKSRKSKAKLKQKEFVPNDFESESESENDVDLSWLPDPDQIYDKSSVDNSTANEESDEDQIHRPPSKLFVQNNKRKHSDESNNEMIGKKKNKILTLDEAENIAMQLLQ